MIILLLKILGLVLLALVGLLLLSLGLLLFVPVRYTARAEGEGLRVGVDVKASWLLRLVRVRYVRAEQEDLSIHVLWFRIRLDEDAEKNEPPPPKIPARAEAHAVARADAQQAEARDAGTVEPAEAVAERYTSTVDERQIGKDDEPRADTGERRRKRERSNEQRERSEGGGMFQRIKEIVEKINYYKNYPNRDAILSATRELLRKLWRAMRPQKLRLAGEVGFESPHHTGYLFAVLGVLNLYPSELKPNFEEQVLRIDASIRGRMNLWSVLWPLFRYAIKRPIWPITKKIFLER